MKRIFLAAVLLFSFSATFAQTSTLDRVIARQSIYLRDRWVDTIQADTAFRNRFRSIPTSDAVARYVAANGGGINGSQVGYGLLYGSQLKVDSSLLQTKTALQSNGGAQVHWGNLTNIPAAVGQNFSNTDLTLPSSLAFGRNIYMNGNRLYFWNGTSYEFHTNGYPSNLNSVAYQSDVLSYSKVQSGNMAYRNRYAWWNMNIDTTSGPIFVQLETFYQAYPGATTSTLR